MAQGIQDRGILVVVHKEILGLPCSIAPGFHLSHSITNCFLIFCVVKACSPDVIL